MRDGFFAFGVREFVVVFLTAGESLDLRELFAPFWVVGAVEGGLAERDSLAKAITGVGWVWRLDCYGRVGIFGGFAADVEEDEGGYDADDQKGDCGCDTSDCWNREGVV